MYQMKKGGSSKSSKQQAAIAIAMKAAGKKPKMAKGGSFPDLTGDGKITQADVLKGRGVFKKGGSVTIPKTKKYKLGGSNEGKPVIKGVAENLRKTMDSEFDMKQRYREDYNRQLDRYKNKYKQPSSEQLNESFQNKQALYNLNQKKKGGSVGKLKK